MRGAWREAHWPVVARVDAKDLVDSGWWMWVRAVVAAYHLYSSARRAASLEVCGQGEGGSEIVDVRAGAGTKAVACLLRQGASGSRGGRVGGGIVGWGERIVDCLTALGTHCVGRYARVVAVEQRSVVGPYRTSLLGSSLHWRSAGRELERESSGLTDSLTRSLVATYRRLRS